MFNIKTLITSLALASTVTLSSVQAETLRLGHVTPPSHIWHKTADRFAENLSTATSNEMNIKIFPLSKLGSHNQMIDLLQSGAIQLAIIAAGSISNRSDSMNAWFLPYTFSDVTEAANASQSAQGQQLLADLREHKLVGLGYSFAGMRHVISTDPITDIDGFANKKIRSFPNKVFNDWWKSLGAAPTALAIGDVTSALTTNLLDGVDVDLDIIVGLKMYQQAPHLTVTNHMAFPGVVVASEKWWNKLSTEEQQTVMTAFKEAEVWGFEQQAKAEISNLEKLRSAGVQVHEIDRSALKEISSPIIEKYKASNEAISGFYTSHAK